MGIKYMTRNSVTMLVLQRDGKEYRSYLDTTDLVGVIKQYPSVFVVLCGGNPYIQLSRGGRSMFLHRVLLGLKPGNPLQGDHINGNTLDNRRKNLRSVTPSINRFNQGGARCDNSCGIRGVHRNSPSGPWIAQVGDAYLGQFRDIRDAVETIWLCLLAVDPISASRYLRELPAQPPFLTSGAKVPKLAPRHRVRQITAANNPLSTSREGAK